MSASEIPKTYNAKDWENKLYTQWEESGFFRPEADQPWADNPHKNERYCNILPPPNANGELHLGHASGYTVMDIFGRFERMKGKKVLLLPGKDHAGIQTQVVFEKKLQTEKNITRHDLGREKFFEEIYAFCKDRAEYMRSQEKRIGLSADWSREKFTLDPDISRRATETFVTMYNDKMIYRGERIINWCPRCATALSDVEIEYQTKKEKLYWIKYGPFVLATSRPETKLGDTAVAVHPDDDRYKDFIGKKIIIPGVLGNFEVVVVADTVVDRAFGSGVIKVTPAHDFADFAIAERHHLPIKQVINTDGRMMDNCGKYAGMTTQECRTTIVTDMQAMDLIEKIEEYNHNLSLCERCKTTIEPLISKQWFINVDAPHYSLKKKSVEALKNNAIIFHPEAMKEQMIRWIENLHDWCISRQIWWGHRIPVWYKKQSTNNKQQTTEKIYCGIQPPEGDDWTQDPDTLDTWFSSGQWPYTTLEYPDGKDAKQFYPTDTMIMGRDLLFFWATRMILFGFYTTHTAPFKHLYFTGLVRDKIGQKMSKSKGNGVDVLEMIKKFGADAVRLSLTLGTTPGLDFRLYEEKIATFRNFANKLWNIGRYVNQQTTENKQQKLPKPKSPADQWILVRLQYITKEVTQLLENYQLSLAGEKLRDFTWNEFADWYVEIHKIEKNNEVLHSVFATLLKLWHPFIPFVTEALWQTLYKNSDTLLMMEQWPKPIPLAKNTLGDVRFENVIRLIQEIRAIRSLYKIDPAKYISLTIKEGANKRALITESGTLLQRLARIDTIHIIRLTASTPKNSVRVSYGWMDVYIELAGVIDFDVEKTRLTKEKKEKETYITALETKLSNPNFIQHAKPDIVQTEQEKLEEVKKQLSTLNHHLASLS